MRIRIITLLICMLQFATIATAQDWVQYSSPSPRVAMGMAYDRATAKILLFGGKLGDEIAIGGTWSWGLGGWSQLHPSTFPSPRTGQGMANDGVTHTVVLFGGWDGTTEFNDTWTWDGENWIQQFPPVSPPPRGNNPPGMDYDGAAKNVVLFGGQNHNFTDFNDTWTWDGVTKTWTQQFPAMSPSPRFAPMAFDRATGDVVLFGGDEGGTRLGDTWVWNGVAGTWTQKFPADSPANRSLAAMAFDEDLQRVVLFGGNGGPITDIFNDTWEWDGVNWTQRSPQTVPHNRYGEGMAYDIAAGALIMFGGYSSGPALGDTWVLN